METYLRLLTLLGEGFLALLLLRLLLPREVRLARHLLEGLGVDTFQVDLGRGGYNIAGVDSAQGHTVDLEGSGHQ